MASAGAIKLMPALLTSTSTRPQRESTACAKSATASSLVTSEAALSTSVPRLVSAATVSAGARRSIKASPYPRSASTSAVRRPIPCAAPVITATFIPATPRKFSSYRQRARQNNLATGMGQGENLYPRPRTVNVPGAFWRIELLPQAGDVNIERMRIHRAVVPPDFLKNFLARQDTFPVRDEIFLGRRSAGRHT